MTYRREHDNYPTPRGLVEAALTLLPSGLAPASVLDPGAGGGAWGKAARARWPQAHLTGIELRPERKPRAYDRWLRGTDFLSWCGDERFALILGNPPYREAEAFVRAALALLAPDGYLLFLLRLGFLAGQARGAGLWRDHPPARVAVCSRRPSFTADGKTDGSEYALFLWSPGHRGAYEGLWLDFDDPPAQPGRPSIWR